MTTNFVHYSFKSPFSPQRKFFFLNVHRYYEKTNQDIFDTYSTVGTLPPEMFGVFGSVWCKMALGEVGVSLP